MAATFAIANGPIAFNGKIVKLLESTTSFFVHYLNPLQSSDKLGALY